MFQSFGAQTSPQQGPPRLAALRAQMAQTGLDAFLVPRSDAHQGEYVAPCDERLAWLTGFTGSAGFCAVLADIAGVFIDGRYRLQVRDQVAKEFTPVHWPEVQLADWLTEQLPEGGKVGFDPWLHSVDEIVKLTKALDETAIILHATGNIVDRIWQDRPAPPAAPYTVHPREFSGEDHDVKRKRVATGTHVITLPDSIAWLLNIRGTDVERNPVPHTFAVLHADGSAELFGHVGKADEKMIEHLGDDVRLQNIASFLDDLIDLDGPFHIDPKSCPEIVRHSLVEAKKEIIHTPDPCILPKACKNPTEIAGARAAHLRDGAAMVQFLAWLDEAAPKGGLTEIDVVKKLEKFRRETNKLCDISFETICGAGPNGAIVHYRVTDQTDRPVTLGELLLVDSGGQYLDGTTDITRTISIGPPGADERACYTHVLQGMVAISRVRFPKGIGGQHLDSLARYPLWLAGKDYDHGTGHGVGSYLSVHEGPQGISRRSSVALQSGMILSNEPGYYREGHFGIRIENLIVTVAAPAIAGADDREMLAFETLTWVPFDRRLIDVGLLSQAERHWIDGYHADTLAKIEPLVHGAARDWLTIACAPL